MRRLSCYILEGTWWGNREVPQILPFFQALANTRKEIDLSHRTIRNAKDLDYWISKIPRNREAFLYIGCHGSSLSLRPTDSKNIIEHNTLLDILYESVHESAVSFLHFGCCEMVDPHSRRKTLLQYLESSGAQWVSGYTREIDWLQSMLLDLALIAELAVPATVWRKKGESLRLSRRGSKFFSDYEQLVRRLGFSGLYRGYSQAYLYPRRMSAS